MPQPDALLGALRERGAALPARLEWHPAIGSTSDRLKDLAREGAPEWTVVLADEQAGGRGREGRAWVSPPGGLYLSVLLRPRFAAVALLPLAAGVAVAEAVSELGVRSELKWPNDVLVSGRKLAGILAESASFAGGVEWVVLGIGVNVAPAAEALPEDLRAGVAWVADAGRTSEPARVAAPLLASLRVWYDALAVSGPAVVAAWRSRAAPWWGEPVEVRTGDGTLHGRMLEVDDDGALLVGTPDGTTRRVLSGDVLRVRRKE